MPRASRLCSAYRAMVSGRSASCSGMCATAWRAVTTAIANTRAMTGATCASSLSGSKPGMFVVRDRSATTRSARTPRVQLSRSSGCALAASAGRTPCDGGKVSGFDAVSAAVEGRRKSGLANVCGDGPARDSEVAGDLAGVECRFGVRCGQRAWVVVQDTAQPRVRDDLRVGAGALRADEFVQEAIGGGVEGTLLV